MLKIKTVLCPACWIALLLIAGCAPETWVVVTPPTARPAPNVALVVGEVVDALPADTPIDAHPEAARLEKFRSFLVNDLKGLARADAGGQAVMSGSSSSKHDRMFSSVALGPADSSYADSTLVLTGRVLTYTTGSRMMRYFVGFGAGKGKCVIEMTLRQRGRPGDLFVANFKGQLAGGVYGGSAQDMFRGVSMEVTRCLKKTLR